MIILDDLMAACGGRIYGPVIETGFSSWAYDSRRVVTGECFVAIRTERGDGHDYIAAAVRNGATGILCEREPLTLPGVTCILVPDTRVALRQYATWRIRKYQPEVIGITGSVGKTSTQQAIATLLHRNGSVFDNQTYNDLFGLPLALAGLESQQRAVLELASGGFGEMAELCRMVTPRIAIVTNVALAHMRAFGTLDAAAGEYSTLIRSLPPDGVAILNSDDPRVRAMASLTKARILTYGYAAAADVRAEQVEPHAEGTHFTLVYGSQHHPVYLRLLGVHHVHTALATAAVGFSLGLHIDEIAEGLDLLCPLPGRLRPIPGRGKSVILDDSYSASPPSVLAALDLLALQPGKRIAVLGDMLGLGPAEDEGYRVIAGALAGRVDHVIAYGDASERLVRLADVPSTVTLTHADAAAAVRRQIESAESPPASILVKGSEGMRTEAIVELLMEQPERAAELLVRQAAPLRAPAHRPVERPAWIEVDLDAIATNARKLKALIGSNVQLMAILKADAYGHGARRVARTALLNGATWLGTATLSEALALRESDIDAPTLILSYVPPWQVAEAVRNDLRISLFSLDVARQLGKEATLQGKRARAHLKVDTGMGRLGILPADVLAFMGEVARIPNLEIEGIYTHFATADDANLDYAYRQLAEFNAVLEKLYASGYRFKLVHAANSAATLHIPEARFDMVRCGIALYGLPPSEHVSLLEGMGPALAFKAQVAQVKQFPPGSCISYGCRFVTHRESMIAVLPVGYGDGFRRTPQNWGYVLIHGQPAPITGVVCMDMCMVDVTDIPGVRPGDEAVLIGRQGDAEINVPQIARQLGTISYEVISQLLARVPREPV